MKLSQLIKAWDILHVMDVGEIGFCDLDNALTKSGVIIENDISRCQPEDNHGQEYSDDDRFHAKSAPFDDSWFHDPDMGDR